MGARDDTPTAGTSVDGQLIKYASDIAGLYERERAATRRVDELESENAALRDTIEEELSVARAQLVKYARDMASLYTIQRKTTQEAAEILKQASTVDRQAALGVLAAGVAHEINHYLAVITSYSRLVLIENEPTLKPHSKDDLAKIHEASKDATALLRKMQDLARPGEASAGSTSVLTTLDKVTSLFRARMRKRSVTLETTIEPETLTAWIAPADLAEIFLNLVANAMDAFDGAPGRISVVATALDDGRARIVVEDDGPGIPEAIAECLFDPFVTTKPEGKGTGLGLNLVRTIVEKSQGMIYCEPAPGGGARFVMELPVSPRGK